MIKQASILLLFMILLFNAGNSQSEVYTAEHGDIFVTSDAPLELINFQSHSLRGILNPATKSFAFTIAVGSFHGFNSDIQRVHFLENYMEQKKYPQATFTGKIIEDIPFDVPGTYPVRAKGELDIHGVKKERIIKGTLVIKPGSMQIVTNFLVPLSDHALSVPKIVQQKIAEQVDIRLDISFAQGPKS
jgi:hypothetical protein